MLDFLMEPNKNFFGVVLEGENPNSPVRYSAFLLKLLSSISRTLHGRTEMFHPSLESSWQKLPNEGRHMSMLVESGDIDNRKCKKNVENGAGEFVFGEFGFSPIGALGANSRA